MTVLPGRRFAWVVMAGVLAALLLGAVASTIGVGGRDEGAAVTPSDGAQVVVVGVPGLSWSDVGGAATPTLAGWAESGASGVLVVRGAHQLTCAVDGWLTLSAGQRASADLPGGVPGAACGPQEVGLSAPGGEPAGSGAVTVDRWSQWLERAAARPLDARPGSLAAGLAAAGECVSAYGPLAAVGAAGPDGLVADYHDITLPQWSGELSGRCRVHLVDGSAGLADPGAVAAEGVGPAALDAELDRLLEAWPEDVAVVVAGLSDRGDQVGLRTVLLSGVEQAGAEQGGELLTSPSTRQPGMVQTADLTATVLSLAGAPAPAELGGQPVRIGLSVDDPSQRHTDTAAAGTLVQDLAAPFLVVSPVLALALLGLASRHSRTAVAVVATGAQAVPAATFLAQLVPWWRVPGVEPQAWGLTVAGLALTGAIALGVLPQLLLAWGGPWRRSAVGPPAVVAAAGVVIIALDVMGGGRLGLTSVLGVQPVVGGRFYGMGNVGFGIVAASTLLLAGLLASALHRGRPTTGAVRAAGGAVLALGLAVAAVDGWPAWGADFGGVPAILVGTGLLTLAALGARLTPVRVLLLGLLALGAAAVLMVADWLRPVDQRTHLGAFAQSVLDGSAGAVVARKLDQSLGILVRYPASWLAVLALVLLAWAVLSPGSPPGRVVARLWRVPLLRATAQALLATLVVAWALNDSGIAIVGIGLAVAVTAAVAIWVRLPTVPSDTGQPGAAPGQRPPDVPVLPSAV